ncbi:MAG TPA: hypothetical protein H9906_02490, partial [Candidatus Paenalcaligenes intestinipullorum]|nr:hypothetical protein [Candidatus Paenalcaligenes intestinipullorum]
NTQKIRKNILQFTHASGYDYGQNFLNVDILQSSKKDPTKNEPGHHFQSPYGTTGATEAYLVYRHQLYVSKLADADFSFGPVKDVTLTAGFDLNTKNTEFAPRKRLLVVGPTFKFDVPKGFVDLSLLYGKEWNHCGICNGPDQRNNVSFNSQFIASLAWALPFDAGAVPLKFQGLANFNGPKGRDGQNVKTKSEIMIRASLMADVGKMAFDKQNTLWVGVGYEFWHNKFGNRYDAAGNKKPGIRTTAPMLLAEWHF